MWLVSQHHRAKCTWKHLSFWLHHHNTIDNLLYLKGYSSHTSITVSCLSSNHTLLFVNVLPINSSAFLMSGWVFKISAFNKVFVLLYDSSSSKAKRIEGYGCLPKSSLGFLVSVPALALLSFSEDLLIFWCFVYKNCFQECWNKTYYRAKLTCCFRKGYVATRDLATTSQSLMEGFCTYVHNTVAKVLTTCFRSSSANLFRLKLSSVDF